MPSLPSTVELRPSTIDWPVICTLLIVAGIISFQTMVVFAFLRIHTVRSEMRWRLLREKGLVIVDGPMLIWADNLPPRPTLSTFNLHDNLHRSGYRA